VQPDEERQEERLRLGLRLDQAVLAEDRRKDHGLSEARDREQLGHALDQTQHDRLEVRDHPRASPVRMWTIRTPDGSVAEARMELRLQSASAG